MRFSFGWKTVAIGIAVLTISVVGALSGMEYYTSQSTFCGLGCHIMAEPYNAWKSSKHYAENNEKGEQAECVVCHFLPGEKRTLTAKFKGLRHAAAYFFDPYAPLPIRAKLRDGSCLTSGCHSKEKFQDKEIEYINSTTFKHKIHFEKGLEGLNLNCTTCHFKYTVEKHFEVPKELCSLCHLKPKKIIGDDPDAVEVKFETVKFNQGLAKCDMCHKIPTKSLQKQKSEDDTSQQPITHQTLQKAGVSCESCHIHVVKGTGKVVLGKINAGGCLTCHNVTADLVAKVSDKKLMHDKHVESQKAGCFDCHDVIQHGEKKNYMDDVRLNCTLCHPDHHKFQKMLLAGETVVEGVSGAPGFMDAVKTNCTGCHIRIAHNKGQVVKTGTGEACAACHTKEHSKMLQDWKDFLGREVEASRKSRKRRSWSWRMP